MFASFEYRLIIILRLFWDYSPVHLGPDRGWRINKGDRFENASVLFNPRVLPLSLKQVVGFPMIVTETHWVPPLGYQSEAPFLAAAYQSLTGVDAAFWNGTYEIEWSNRDRAEWDSASRAKWSIATPMMLGQFPAAALLFRRGDLTSGHPAVVEHRSLEQLWGRVPPIIAEDPSYDPNRDLGDTARRLQLAGGVDPLVFLVGPVQVVYGSDPAKTTVADLSRYIDREKKVVRSNTGQLAWDYGRGLCTLDAPRAQGVTGLLRQVGSIKLGDVTIRSENQYATILVVSLDGARWRAADASWSRSARGPGLQGGPITRRLSRSMGAAGRSRAARSTIREECPGSSMRQGSRSRFGTPA